MRVLHLTDFHYKEDPPSIADQNELISYLCESLSNKQPVDFFFFTGDLVFEGNRFEDFTNAKVDFIDKVAYSLNLTPQNIFVCAGNHDVYENQEMEAISTYLKEKIVDNELLNAFVRDLNDSQFLESCKNLNNYFAFTKQFYSNTGTRYADRVHPLFSSHQRNVDNKRIGIVTINTSWRANSDRQKQRLLFPTSIVKQSIDHLRESDCRILLCHHELSDLADFNRYELEDEIYQAFHFMFSGHTHKRKQSVQITTREGIFCCCSPATLSLHKQDTEIGYTLLDTNLDTLDVEIVNVVFDRQDRVFLEQKPICLTIPVDSVKKERNEFRRTLKKRYAIELEKANDLFISTAEADQARNFLELFSEPVLKTLPRAEITHEKDTYSYRFSDLLIKRDNYIIYGKDKSGRTALLKKLQLEFLRGFSDYLTIPYYFDYTEFKRSQQKLKLINKLASYWEMSQANFSRFSGDYHVKLLIDNFDPYCSELNRELKDFLEKHSNLSFLAVSDETASRTYEYSSIRDFPHDKLYIYDLTRREIRSLTEKWPNIASEKKEFIVDKIINIFTQLHIPYNYWSVSLFLWIFEKTSDLNFHNNVDLIELYIDSLLEKERIPITKFKLPFENFKAYLGELACFLVKKFYEEIYSATYSELISFTEEYRKKNVRFVIGTKEIVDHVIDKRIIYQRDDERYTFRLKGVFEYFLAYHMKNDMTFRDEIVDNKGFYPGFANELELYSGFSKRDLDFLKKVYSKAREVLDCINEKHSRLGTADENLIAKLQEVLHMTVPVLNFTEKEQNPLSPEIQDKLMESFQPINDHNTDVEKKEIYADIESSPESFEKFLFILSRVFRNIDMITDVGLIHEIFDYIIDSACSFGFELIENIQSSEEESTCKSDSELATQILELLTNFMPLIVQIHLYDGLGHVNLVRVIEDKISSLKPIHNRNQFKLFLLYCLLIDIDVKSNFKYIDDLISVMHLDVLKTSTLIKLYSYLMFKCYKNPSLEKEIRKRIQNVSMMINKEVDLGKLQKRLEEKRKQILLRPS